MFDFIVVLGSFIDIMMSEIDKLDKDKSDKTIKAEKVRHAVVCVIKCNEDLF